MRKVTATLLLAGVAAFALAPGTAWADERTGTLDGVEVADGAISAVLTAQGLQPGQVLDSSSVEVRLNGAVLPSTATRTGTDEVVERRAVLLIDVSGSMQGAGIDSAREAALAFLDLAPADVGIGILAFNDTVSEVIGITTDREAARQSVSTLSASRETALYDGVVAAVQALGSEGDRTLVVLSDGGDTISRTSLKDSVAALGGSGVRADVVGLNTDESQDAALAQIASAGRGTVTTTADSQSLAQAFAVSAAALDSQLSVQADLPDDAAGAATLTVTANASDDVVRADIPVALPQLPASAPAVPAMPDTSVVPVPAVPQGQPWTAYLLPIAVPVALAVFVLAMLMMAPLFRSQGKTRLRQLDVYSRSGRRDASQTELASDGSTRQLGQPLLDLSARFVENRGLEREMALRLDKADLPFRPHEWIVLRLAAALVVAAVFAVLGGGLLGTILGVVLGFVGTGLYRRLRTARRQKRFATQLPDALALVASSLQTGFSLPQALDAVSRDVAAPLGVELGRALAEARLGAEVEDALERVSERMESEDMRWTVMAIRIQRQVGGNLAETLRATVSTVRERAMLKRMVQALSAEGKLSAYILVGLPFAMAGYLFLTNRPYLSALWTNAIGWALLAVAAIGMAIGIFWMSKVIKVEV